MMPALIPRWSEPDGKTSKSFRISFFRAAQMFQTATSIARAAEARGRFLPGHAMACSLWDSLQGSRGTNLTSPDPSNQLPHSAVWASQKALGKLHRFSATFKE